METAFTLLVLLLGLVVGSIGTISIFLWIVLSVAGGWPGEFRSSPTGSPGEPVDANLQSGPGLSSRVASPGGASRAAEDLEPLSMPVTPKSVPRPRCALCDGVRRALGLSVRDLQGKK